MAHERDVETVRNESLGNEQPQFPVSQYKRLLPRKSAELLEDLACGGERFRENRGSIVDLVGNGQKIPVGNHELLGKYSVGVEDAEHGTSRTVA